MLRAERAVAAEQACALDHIHRVAVQVGDDRRIFCAMTGGAQAEFRVEHHAWSRIEWGLALARVARVRGEIGAIALGIRRRVAADQGHALGAQHMIGSGRPALRNPCHVRAATEREAARILMRGEDQRASGELRQIPAQCADLGAQWPVGRD